MIVFVGAGEGGVWVSVGIIDTCVYVSILLPRLFSIFQS